ncbi:MAG: universal stress protein [Trueperaceae bacterium]|nr:MAG: universal stress protein [Trueperaceae bacterium]
MAAHKALIPFDGSDFSRQVLGYVRSLLNPKEYTLTLFRVAPVPQGYPLVPQRPLVLDAWMFKQMQPVEEHQHPIYASQVWESFRAELMDDMADEMEDLREAGFNVSLAVHFGDPATEIINFADNHDFELVVMATHGRSGVLRMLMGSVAEKVLRGLRVPVMMVRPVQKGAAEEVPAKLITT